MAVAFVAGSFVASPELRAFAANTVGSIDIIDNSIQSVDIKDLEVKTSDLAGNAVTAAKIKDGEVKAAEIATDAVGAAEIAGVTKLIFGKCTIGATVGSTPVAPGKGIFTYCNIPGVFYPDRAVAMYNGGNDCWDARSVSVGTDTVRVLLVNHCSFTSYANQEPIGIIVYDK